MDPSDRKRRQFRGMRHATQHSAGGVVYKKEGSRVKVCLLAKRGGRVWVLPRGRVNPGETLEQTAQREILEETGHLIEIGAKLDEINFYFFLKENQTFYHKTVTFFLVKLVQEDFRPRDQEADVVRWFDLGEARKRLTYHNERKVLQMAQSLIKLVR